ncbi:MAG: DUF1902 domain-containing protein [Hyphomicrobiaceae bacterium]
MIHQSIIVRATWDDDARVWVATSEDVPGLVAESAILEALRDKVLVMVPELLELNGGSFVSAEIPIHFMAEQTTRIANPALSA